MPPGSAPGSAHVRNEQLTEVDAHWTRLIETLRATPRPEPAEPRSDSVAPRSWAADLLPADLLLEQLETATRASLREG